LHYLSTLHSDRERTLTKRVRLLAARCEDAINPSSAEEDFLQLGVGLLEYYDQIRAQAALLPVTRESTRRELFRRLLVARDYIHAHAASEISLNAVARAACLSPFHFHRGFTQAFQQTPHHYLTELRLAQARDMLCNGISVLDACVAVGFSSHSAFSRLFRRRFGQSPSSLRCRFARSDKRMCADSGIFDT
jgi:AraC-like DNA-binding protein